MYHIYGMRHMLAWLLSSLFPPPGFCVGQANAPTTSAAAKGTFRFWHEERRFKGSGERCIVQRALFEHGEPASRRRAPALSTSAVPWPCWAGGASCRDARCSYLEPSPLTYSTQACKRGSVAWMPCRRKGHGG